ncbi:MAG: shikimate kinase [Epsilonproteobacteria bacterium]|nr:shikimate kinase [Campylobacterota bacterium]NPA57316.1 shikimate kinase [Campylobacterota bacterium]
MDNIVLIGFMGVGKGTLARALAGKTGLYAVDTDDLIESLTNMKIRKIFKKKGERYFRELERQTAQWLAQNVRQTIISTGGGFYQVENLKEIGTVVYLRADFDWIYKRIIKSKNAEKKLKKRPLFKSYKKAKNLYRERVEGYERVADLIIDVEGKELDQLIEELKPHLPTSK